MKDRQRLVREGLVLEEKLDDARRQDALRERELPGAQNAGAVDPREHALLAEPPDGVRGAALRAGAVSGAASTARKPTLT